VSLQPKTSATDQAGIVMEVIFKDTKKTIIIRSPLQVGLPYRMYICAVLTHRLSSLKKHFLEKRPKLSEKQH